MFNIIAEKFGIVSDNDFPHSVVNRTPQVGFRSPCGSLGLYPAIGELEDQWPVPISKSSRNTSISLIVTPPDAGAAPGHQEWRSDVGLIDQGIVLRPSKV